MIIAMVYLRSPLVHFLYRDRRLLCELLVHEAKTNDKKRSCDETLVLIFVSVPPPFAVFVSAAELCGGFAFDLAVRDRPPPCFGGGLEGEPTAKTIPCCRDENETCD